MIATVILAAGEGRRLGGDSKPLIKVAGETLAARSLGAALAAGTAPVLVLSYQAEEVVRMLERECAERLRSSQLVTVRGSGQGTPEMAASFRAGVQRAADLGAAQIAVLLVDQPGIGAPALRAVLEAHDPGRVTRGAVFGRASHPVVFDTDDALAAAGQAEGDEGARRYLRAHEERVCVVDLTGVARDADLDTPQDLAAWSAEPHRSGPW
ncbi:nucleotidyltransferase family protein [Nesterenkonia muleiensis]|uniref:nucleotidyltransferase family protein n=1 Tax=Nesterenkonia muleiensis TaxID=2282648 RepID=UPI0013005F50|nr:NTP transferase domain-containing protein [Nesterenkonia muleiensis]